MTAKELILKAIAALQEQGGHKHVILQLEAALVALR